MVIKCYVIASVVSVVSPKIVLSLS